MTNEGADMSAGAEVEAALREENAALRAEVRALRTALVGIDAAATGALRGLAVGGEDVQERSFLIRVQ